MTCVRVLFTIGRTPFDIGYRYKFDPCLAEGGSLVSVDARNFGKWIRLVEVPAYGETSSNVFPGPPIVYFDIFCFCTLRLKFKLDITVTGNNRAAVVQATLHLCDKAGEAGEQCNGNIRGATGGAVGLILKKGLYLGATKPIDFGPCPADIIIPIVIGVAVLVVIVIISIIVYCRKKKSKKEQKAVSPAAPPQPMAAVPTAVQGVPMQPMHEQTSPPPVAKAGSSGIDVAKLKELKELLDAGVLTQAEFDAEKKALLEA